jgi:hypothetical protein
MRTDIKVIAMAACAAALGSCGAMPDRSCMASNEVGTVSRVIEEKVRGGSNWRVAFTDAKGMTQVCRGGVRLQVLQPGDRIDGRGLWRED